MLVDGQESSEIPRLIGLISGILFIISVAWFVKVEGGYKKNSDKSLRRIALLMALALWLPGIAIFGLIIYWLIKHIVD